MSCGYIRGEGRFQTTSPPPSLRYHIFRLPVSTRQLPFASILLAYTRHGLSLSRGYCLSSNGRRMRAWPLSRVQVRAYTGIESSNEFGIRYVYVYLYIYIYIRTYVYIEENISSGGNQAACRAIFLLERVSRLPPPTLLSVFDKEERDPPSR